MRHSSVTSMVARRSISMEDTRACAVLNFRPFAEVMLSVLRLLRSTVCFGAI